MKTFSKIFLVLTLAIALMAFVSPKTVMSQCDPDVPFLTTLPYPDAAAGGLEGKVTFPHQNPYDPLKRDYYRDMHCGINPLMIVDPCNPFTLEFYMAAWEQKPGGDLVQVLPINIPWNQDSCQVLTIDFVYPVGYTYGQFADSIVFKVTMKPHEINGCSHAGMDSVLCYQPIDTLPPVYAWPDCWRDCMNELFTIEAQDDCTPPNSAICRIEWDKPLPVELISFTSAVKDNNVTLNWTTANEKNNARFIVQRTSEGTWSDVGIVAGNGTTNEISSYMFIDRNLNSGVYNYRLKQIDYNGNFEYMNLNGAVAVGVPDKFSMSQNYPNPFNPTTTILYGVPKDGIVTMKVYDMNGKEVKTLVNEPKSAGYHTVSFDGTGLSSGVYFYKLESGDFVTAKKMVILK